MESLRFKERRPSHPGKILREVVLPDLAITQTEFARELGVSRRTVSELINGKRQLTPDMAIRLARLIGGTPGGWLKIQQALDLWEVEHAGSKKHVRIKKLRAPKVKKAG